MKFLSSLLFIASLTLASCTPESFIPATYAPVVRDLQSQTIAIFERKEETPRCTGVWVAEYKILTAAHCIDTEHSIYYATFQESKNAFEEPDALHSMSLAKVDKEHDLALYETSRKDTPKHQVATLAYEAPPQGASLHFYGHTRGLSWSYKHGWVSAYRDESFMENVKGPWIQVAAPVSFGDSGGGAFNEQGELVGIASRLFRNAPLMAFYVHTHTIIEFLN